jgi:acetoin utilization deacetylase AcuC-like enzyme
MKEEGTYLHCSDSRDVSEDSSFSRTHAELAVRSASAPPYQQHPAHHMPPSMMQPSAASPQLPSLMQLSQQQMGRQQYMQVRSSFSFSSFLFCERLVSVRAHRPAGQQTLQEAAEDSKNLDTFDNSTPISSGSLADLSAASASLEMAAAAAARTSTHYCCCCCSAV